MTEQLTKRQQAKATTRAKVIAGAKALWKEPGTYHVNGIREIAALIGMSTGAVFANFKSKDDLWRAAFQCEPPIDSVMTRAAPALFTALQDLLDARPGKDEGVRTTSPEAWRVAEALAWKIKQQLQDAEGEQPKTWAEAAAIVWPNDAPTPLENAA